MIFIFASALLLRIILSFLPGFEIDIAGFSFWAFRMANSGPWNFYEGGVFADYAPGYLYFLGFLGLIAKLFSITSDSQIFTLFLKLSPITFDLLSAFLIYKLLSPQKKILQISAGVIYLFHPAVLFIGPVWGQVDSILSFFLLLTIYFLIKDKPLWASFSYVLAFWIKPQAIAVLPIFLILLLKTYPLKTLLRALGIFALLSLTIVLPFFPTAPYKIILQLQEASQVYPYTSFFAYNFWAIFDGFRSDSSKFLEIPLRIWGFILYFGGILPMLFLVLKRKNQEIIVFGFALSVMAFFLFMTRMHERYLFPFILLFLPVLFYYKKISLWLIFLGVSMAHFLNLYAAYAYYNLNAVRIDSLFKISSSLELPLSIFLTFTYAILVIIFIKEGK